MTEPDQLDIPAPPDPPDQTQPAEVAEPAPDWQNWLYTGPGVRIYTNIPLTATNGAIITWHSQPATDGCWTTTTDPANTRPDNYRPEPADGGAEPTQEG